MKFALRSAHLACSVNGSLIDILLARLKSLVVVLEQALGRASLAVSHPWYSLR